MTHSRWMLACAFLMMTACGGGASASSSTASTTSTESTTTSGSSDSTAASSDTTTASTDTSAPPACVPMGQACDQNQYCCYGSCRVEGSSTTPVCAP